MAFCYKCGSEVEENAKFCAKCGADLENPQETPASDAAKTDFTDVINNITETEDTTAEFDAKDIENNKILSLFSYLWILFLVPMFAAKDSKFARFHVNQGIVLFIFNIAWSIVDLILSAILGKIIVVSLVYGILSSVVSLAFFALAILGIVNACMGKAKKLPLIPSNLPCLAARRIKRLNTYPLPSLDGITPSEIRKVEERI